MESPEVLEMNFHQNVILKGEPSMGYFRLANLGKDEISAIKNVLSALKKNRALPTETPAGTSTA